MVARSSDAVAPAAQRTERRPIYRQVDRRKTGASHYSIKLPRGAADTIPLHRRNTDTSLAGNLVDAHAPLPQLTNGSQLLCIATARLRPGVGDAASGGGGIAVAGTALPSRSAGMRKPSCGGKAQ
jgi:hypothetical protein